MSFVPNGDDYASSRAQKYYFEEPAISPTVKKIFVEHSGLAESEIVPHVKGIREKAWTSFPYPCIGSFAFLELAVQIHPLSSEILSRLTTGPKDQTFLDVGCCFAQDVRFLATCGAPAQNLTGFDLRPEFIDMGYELFRDRETLKSRFVVGDVFDDDCAVGRGQFDLINTSFVFHLFNWEEQVEAFAKAVTWLKQKPGSLVFGRAAAAEPSDLVEHPTARSGMMYRQSPESWKKLVQEVGEKTGTQLQGHAQWDLDGVKDETLMKEGFRAIFFSIRIV